MTTVERTRRWRTAFTVALATSSAGVYLDRPLLLLASIVGVAYAAYPLLTAEPSVDLALSRGVSDDTPAHDDVVSVTVTVTNTGSRTLADLRLVDGVPPHLAVTDGTARHTATLRPGSSTTFRYSVTAKHGEHRFQPATAVVHDISGSVRVRTEIPAGTDPPGGDTLECPVDASAVRRRRRARRYAGRTPTDTSGSGIEFSRTRAYRRGDPADRIDWGRYARTGSLTTVSFRAERRARVVLCLDARARAIRARRPPEPHALWYSTAAATAVFSHLREAGERVGVASFGADFSWLAPDTGYRHPELVRERLGAHRDRGATRADGRPEAAQPSVQLGEFLRRSGDTTDVVLFSSLLDDFGVTAARRLETTGHSVTVVSPDVTTDATLGAEVARVERRHRVRTLRAASVPVCDWTPGTPLGWPGAGRS